MDTQNQESEEKILAQFDKSETDQVRIRETVFKGKTYIDIRIFTKNQQGDFIPTKKGVTLTKEKMAELKETLSKITL